MPSETYQAFIAKVRELHLATSIESILSWDQETYMPKRGGTHRAAQLAFIAGVGHRKLIDSEFSALLEKVEAEGDEDPVVATNVRETRRIFDRKVKLPTDLVEELARTSSLARTIWVEARRTSDFRNFAPILKKLFELKRAEADHIGYTTEPYDALMDEYEPGAQAAEVAAVFDGVRNELVPIVKAIATAPRKPNSAVLKLMAPLAQQEQLCRHLAEAIGFDFDAGRIDTTTHPFCSGTCPDDVRLTTRYDEHYLPMSLFGILHEAGHGLYEQGLDSTHTGTPMGQSVSLGIHESQSRLWENQVGRSRPFWNHQFAELQKCFPAYAQVSLEDWYFAINKVEPSLIRVEADEVTYNLHIMLRFDLERRLLAGKLAVDDIPGAWNDGMQKLLGITPPDDAHGCLQDIHWSLGAMGYFPTYALGNLYAAQFFAAASQAIPELDVKIARANFKPLLEWLREHIHQHGQRYRAAELCEVVTGQPLSPEPYLNYLRRKFKPLYGF